MAVFIRLILFGGLLVFPSAYSGYSQVGPQRRPELIRDTDAAEGKAEEEEPEVEKPKELDPLLAAQNLKIGNYYFKRKNYDAAIQRYLDAIGYQPGLTDAYEALARAYERNGNLSKAIEVFEDFIRKHPDSPKVTEFQARADRLAKK